MTGTSANARVQVDRNFEAFQARLPELLATHHGKTALMKDGEIVDFFDSYADAVRFGLERFKSIDAFSVQQITDKTLSVGIYSYAGVLQ